MSSRQPFLGTTRPVALLSTGRSRKKFIEEGVRIHREQLMVFDLLKTIENDKI
jgi:hypothetical protein